MHTTQQVHHCQATSKRHHNIKTAAMFGLTGALRVLVACYTAETPDSPHTDIYEVAVLKKKGGTSNCPPNQT